MITMEEDRHYLMAAEFPKYHASPDVIIVDVGQTAKTSDVETGHWKNKCQ